MRLRLADSLRHSPWIRAGFTLGRLAGSLLPGCQAGAISAYEKAEHRYLCRLCRPLLPAARRQIDPASDRFSRFHSIRSSRPQLTRSILLKAPGPDGSKGVLALYFEYNLFRLLEGVDDLASFQRDFDLVLCASWSPTDFSLLTHALNRLSGPLFVQPANYSDVEKIEAFDPRLRCVPGLACDWVNPDLFSPIPHARREYDLVMVANWAPFKRHFEFFHALSKMPRSLRVILVGQDEGGYTAATIRKLAADFGVPQHLTIAESISISEVRKIQSNSKAAVILSRREGGCVAAVEALFADTPLAMREDAHVGSLAHVNALTGMKLSASRPLDRQLTTLLESSASIRPRQWAMENISCQVTLRKIESFLRMEALAAGRPWTSSLTPVCWAPYPTYLNVADREAMRPVYDRLHARYPGVFAKDLPDTSHL